MAEPARPDASRPGSATPFPTTAPSRRLPGPLVLWVGLGGAVGVLLNAGTHALLDGPDTALLGGPLATVPGMVVANLLGAFLLGFLNGRVRTAPSPWDPRLVAALGTGVLGGYTSFSALAALLGSPFTAALVAGPGASTAAEVLASFGLALALVVLIAVAGTLCAWAGLRAGSRRTALRGAGTDSRGTDRPGPAERGAR